MPQPKILAMAGSLRAGSFNKKLVLAAARGAEAAGGSVHSIDLADYPMPIYDGDWEQANGLPPQALALKKLFCEHDGLLIASPEFNSSLTAVLKNTIDWLSRPAEGEKPLACFSGKVAAIMATSPGGLGGLRGLVHLRAILSNIGVLVIPDQRAVPASHKAFDDAGQLIDEATRGQIEGLGQQVTTLVGQIHAA